MMREFLGKKIHMIAILFLVVGGLNWLYVALTGGDFVSKLFGKSSLITNGVFFLVGLAALSIAFYRDSYLPFLGETVMPCSLLKEQVPEGADMDVRVTLQPGAKVLYWAAEPSASDLESLNDWRKAYLEFKNAGVTIAGADGVAVLKVRKPQGYTVPMKRELSPHVHYRVCGDHGLLGRVQTVDLEGKEYFENYVSQEESPAEVSEGGAYPIVSPNNALNELNEDAEETARKSLMAETGAMDESPQPAGAPLDAAF